MNKIFKTKVCNGVSIACSELTRNKGIAAVLLSALFAIGSANAAPASIQGVATSKNAVAVGENSYATAVDGVAVGHDSVATGGGWTREGFQQKVNEQSELLKEINDKKAAIATNEAKITGLTNEKGDLTKEKLKIAEELAQNKKDLEAYNAAQPKLQEAQNKKNVAQEALDKALNDIKNISNTEGEIFTSNFARILQSLDLESNLNADKSGYVALGKQLEEKIKTDYNYVYENYFKDKYAQSDVYEESDYAKIVNGYYNRLSGSYQGSYEYLANKYDVRFFVGKNSWGQTSRVNDEELFKSQYHNSELNSNKYGGQVSDGQFSLTSDVSFVSVDTVYGTAYTTNREYGFLKNGKVSYPGYGIITVSKLGVDANELLPQEILNLGLLLHNSNKKSNSDLGFSLIREEGTSGSELFEIVKENSDIFQNLDFSIFEKNDRNSFFGIKVDKNKLNTRSEVIFAGEMGRLNTPYGYSDDKNLLDYDTSLASILTYIDDFSPNQKNLISTKQISAFNENLELLKKFSEAIDLNYDKSPVDQNAYKSSLDNNVISYGDNVRDFLNLYQENVNERKKDNPDKALIDANTVQMEKLRSEILSKTDEASIFFYGVEKKLIQENAEYWLYYGDEETQKDINRINEELRLYEEDEVIKSATDYSQIVQKAVEKAQKDLEEAQKELEEVSNITAPSDLQGLIDRDKEIDGEISNIDGQIDDLNKEIETETEELEKLKEALSETELKELGLRSQAYGSNAFASGDDSIAFGTNATATADDGIAIGRDTEVSGEGSVAIGADAMVLAHQAVALGAGAKINERSHGSTAIGYEVKISGDNSTAVGQLSEIFGGFSTAIGVRNTILVDYANALGSMNNITGEESSVVGNDNSVASNKVMVLGNHINVSEGFDGAVVLGDSSTVAKVNPTSSIVIADKTYNFAGISPTSVVSVGAVGAERQIINIAAGRISETSTDAINGSQLYAVSEGLADFNNRLNNIDALIDGKLAKITQFPTFKGNGVEITKIENGDNIEYTFKVETPEISAPVSPITVSGDENITVNKEGDNYEISLEPELYLNQITINGNTGKISGVVDGEVSPTSTEAINGSQLHQVAETIRETDVKGENGIVVTKNTEGKKDTFTVKVGDKVDVGQVSINGQNGKISGAAKGELSPISTDVVNGSQLYETNLNLNNLADRVDQGLTFSTENGEFNRKLGERITIVGDNNIETSVQEGNIKVALKDEVKVKKITAGNTVIDEKGMDMGGNKITNLADGDITPESSEAVTGRQLFGVINNIQQATLANGNDIVNVGGRVAKLENRMDGLEKKFDKENKNLRAGIAGSAAIAGLPQVRGDGKSMVSAAAGNYRGQNAVAVGYSRASDNGKFLLRLSGSANTQGSVISTIGVGYEW